jgi:hypothetical protein
MGGQIPMLNPPFTGSLPIYIVLGFIIASVALFIGFIYTRVKGLIRRIQRRPLTQIGIITSTLRLLLILLMFFLSTATLFLFAFIQSYTAFTHRTHGATVYCTAKSDVEDEMVLNLVTIDSSTGGHLRHYRLRGQQWAIEGHILKWDDWLTFLGLQTMYKLTRVRGRYLRSEDESSILPSAYSLVANEEDSRWRFLYEYGPQLPFVNAVYGNTVFTFPSATKTFHIFVTTSGFMIEERQ